MSYILDALRKSDQQRRLGGVPTLAYAQVAPIAPERSAILKNGLLGLILIVSVGMLIAWLRPSPAEPAAIVIAAKPLVSPPRQTVPAPPPAAPAKLEPEPTRREAPAATVPTPVLTVPAPRRKQSVTASPDGASDAPSRKPVASSELPSSIRKTLPVMAVAVHAYSATPGDRLVSINGRMLREGDTLAPDLKLEQITSDGMIFTYRGYRFRRGAQ